MTALPRHPLNPDCNWEWPWHFQSYEENNDNNVCYRGIHITLCTRNWWAEPDNWKTSVRSSTCTSTIVVVRLIVQSGKKRIAIIQNIVVLRSRSYFYEARHAGYIPQDKKGLSLNRLKKKRMVQVTSSMVHVTIHGMRSNSPPAQTELTRKSLRVTWQPSSGVREPCPTTWRALHRPRRGLPRP